MLGIAVIIAGGFLGAILSLVGIESELKRIADALERLEAKK